MSKKTPAKSKSVEAAKAKTREKANKEKTKRIADITKTYSANASIVDGEIKLDKSFSAETLPDGVTKDDIKRVQQHFQELVIGGKKAIGELAYRAMAEDSTIDVLKGKIPLGYDYITYTATRNSMQQNPNTNELEERRGQLRSSYHSRSTGKTGHMQSVNKYLTDLADELLW